MEAMDPVMDSPADVADAGTATEALPVLDRNSFLALAEKKRVVKLVEIPEANAKVYIRALTTEERDRLEASFVKSGKGGRQRIDTEGMRAKTLQAGMCDASGALMFSVNEIPKIGKIPAIIADPIYNEILALSRMDRDALEDAEKNSGNGRHGDSS